MTDLPEFTDALSPMQYRLFEVLFSRRPALVDTSVLIDLLYADDQGGGPLTARNTVNVMITKMRHRLPPDWKIVNVWGRGFRVVHTPPPVAPAPVTQPDISALTAIIGKVETAVGDKREALTAAATDLARIVGPAATAHELASLAQEFIALAERAGQEQEAGNG